MLGHHAYLCTVSEPVPDSIKTLIQELAITEVNYVVIDSFGINDVRSLIEKAYIKPIQGDKQVIAVCIKSITIEAQQALLKILEEPPSTTVFVFCVPEGLFLLPTVLSRFQLKKIESPESKSESKEIDEFISLSISERIIEIANRTTKKDTNWIDDIKSGLINILSKDSKKYGSERLRNLYFIAENLQTRGSSNKLLLEELALVINKTTEN